MFCQQRHFALLKLMSQHSLYKVVQLELDYVTECCM